MCLGAVPGVSRCHTPGNSRGGPVEQERREGVDEFRGDFSFPGAAPVLEGLGIQTPSSHRQFGSHSLPRASGALVAPPVLGRERITVLGTSPCHPGRPGGSSAAALPGGLMCRAVALPPGDPARNLAAGTCGLMGVPPCKGAPRAGRSLPLRGGRAGLRAAREPPVTRRQKVHL